MCAEASDIDLDYTNLAIEGEIFQILGNLPGVVFEELLNHDHRLDMFIDALMSYIGVVHGQPSVAFGSYFVAVD